MSAEAAVTGILAASAPYPLRPDAVTEALSRPGLGASASAETETEEEARRAYHCLDTGLGPPLDSKFLGHTLAIDTLDI